LVGFEFWFRFKGLILFQNSLIWMGTSFLIPLGEGLKLFPEKGELWKLYWFGPLRYG